jgi:phosphate acetyltransferase
MTQNLYITGAESGSGKSVIVLAMMEYFSGHTGKTGFFRPVTRSGEQRDQLIHLVTQRYQIDSAYEDLYGCSNDVARQLIAEDRYDELLKRAVRGNRLLRRLCGS